MEAFSISIREVVNLLGLKIDPRSDPRSPSFNVQCPFCNDKKYHMNINTEKNAYSCMLCSKERGQGALDLYGRVVHGDRCVKGVNSKQLYRELCEALHIGDPLKYRTEAKKTLPPVRRNLRAPDDMVNKTYSALLALPELRLSDVHRDNLHRRGLPDNIIARNQYRSIGPDFSWAMLDSRDKAAYDFIRQKAQAADKIMKDNPNADPIKYSIRRTKSMSQEELMAGIVIGRKLAEQGCTMKGVPGFFLSGNGEWCFRATAGMLVPTRDEDGRIVALQTRRDKPADWDTTHPGKEFLRYMTLSSKGFPFGVTEDISRPHCPLGNPKMGPDTKLVIIEGPLKADVTQVLAHWSAQAFFVAIHGTSNTRDLPALFRKAKAARVKTVYTCFDMDKLTNPHVAKSVTKVAELVENAGLESKEMFWDDDECRRRLRDLRLLCAQNDIIAPSVMDIHRDLANTARALEAADITHSRKTLGSGQTVKDYWCDETKGIDDFSLLVQQGKIAEPASLF